MIPLLCYVVVHSSSIHGSMEILEMLLTGPVIMIPPAAICNGGLPPVAEMEEAMRAEGGYISKSGNGTSMAGCASKHWVQT